MKSFSSLLIKLLAIFILGSVALVIAMVWMTVMAHGAKEAANNSAIKVLQMYASPPNRTLAIRFFVVRNTSGKTIQAIKFRVDVFNKLKEKVDDSVVTVEKPIAANSVVYCNVYTLFDNDGLTTDSGCNVNKTNRRLLALARQADCKPGQLQVHYQYKVKVIRVAY